MIIFIWVAAALNNLLLINLAVLLGNARARVSGEARTPTRPTVHRLVLSALANSIYLIKALVSVASPYIFKFLHFS